MDKASRQSYHASVDIEIPFHDVDVMAIVWHGHYAKYFEIARCALLEIIAYNYQQMRDSGYAWPIIDLQIRYIKPATFRQTITVTATVAEWENRLKIDYLIHDKATGAKLVKGHSIQVAVDVATKTLLLESPKILYEKLGLNR